jgi:predicted RNA-binding Zn-ribbon protein involved in translation (DUF1610 family)
MYIAPRWTYLGQGEPPSCSECKEWFTGTGPLTDVCPNCGAVLDTCEVRHLAERQKTEPQHTVVFRGSKVFTTDAKGSEKPIVSDNGYTWRYAKEMQHDNT